MSNFETNYFYDLPEELQTHIRFINDAKAIIYRNLVAFWIAKRAFATSMLLFQRCWEAVIYMGGEARFRQFWFEATTTYYKDSVYSLSPNDFLKFKDSLEGAQFTLSYYNCNLEINKNCRVLDPTNVQFVRFKHCMHTPFKTDSRNLYVDWSRVYARNALKAAFLSFDNVLSIDMKSHLSLAHL